MLTNRKESRHYLNIRIIEILYRCIKKVILWNIIANHCNLCVCVAIKWCGFKKRE